MRVRDLAGRAYVLLLLFGATLLAGVEAMYCGDRNCYDVLKYVTPFVDLIYHTMTPTQSISHCKAVEWDQAL